MEEVTIEDITYPLVKLDELLMYVCCLLEEGETLKAIKILRNITRS